MRVSELTLHQSKCYKRQNTQESATKNMWFKDSTSFDVYLTCYHIITDGTDTAIYLIDCVLNRQMFDLNTF